MIQFDHAILVFLNGLAGQWELFDRFVVQVLQANSVRLLPITSCLVWLWFRPEAAAARRDGMAAGRRGVGLALIGAVLTMAAARLIQNLAPHRPRPMHEAALSLNLPAGIAPDALLEWSSFPSDTAGLAFALAAGVLAASRPLGIACLLWSAIVVSVPRVFAGLHYPSDILGGAALGVAATLALAPAVLRLVRARWPAAPAHRARLYAAGFALLFQITSLFDDVRNIARGARQAVAGWNAPDQDGAPRTEACRESGCQGARPARQVP